ncbi:MAG TPA: PAS domain-containing protein, partial [Desulfatiglandales bacterium]|nr:PAS domain-containing protein [Desulfatiglandales bacterium]
TGAISFEGIINPSWLFNAGLILLAIFLNGYKSGTIWASIIFIQTGVLIYMFRTGYMFPNLIPPEMTATYSMGMYMICLLTILLFAFLFEKEKIGALAREQEKSLTIRESKRYMDEIFDRYPLPTFVLDKNHRVIQWNKACEELSGIPAEEILGKKVWDGFHVSDKGSLGDIVIDDMNSITRDYGESIINQTDSDSFEIDTFLPKLKEGQRVIVTVAPIMGSDKIVKGAIQTIQEIKKLASGGLVKDVLDENFPHPVFKMDSKGKINFWNKACEESLGYSASQMIGNSPLSIIGKNYRQLFKNTFVRALKGESSINQEWRYSTSKGEPMYVFARVFPAPSDNGEAMDCIVVNTNITELRMKIKKLSRYVNESQDKFKTLSEEYELLKKNVATFIRKKDNKGAS